MSYRLRWGRLTVAAALAVGAGAVGLIGPVGTVGPVGPALAAGTPTQDSVTVRVVDLSPTTPDPSKDRPLVVTLGLTNTTGRTLYDLRIDGNREAPVTQQSLLEKQQADPQPILDETASPLDPLPVTAPLPPHASIRLTYRTTTSQQNEPGKICLCQTGIYPLDFTVSAAAEAGGPPSQVGMGQTYLSSITEQVAPQKVSWIWPLIDRPHRAGSATTFIDDDLARSVAPNGRLDRALRVVEAVTPRIALSLVIDPELIDELATMAQGYQVADLATPDRRLAKGTGGPAARAWLDRLRRVVASHDVTLTPYADPDVDALTRAGQGWSADPPDQVRAELGGTVGHDVYLAPGGIMTPDALRKVSATGVSTVILNDSALPSGNDQKPRADAVATLGGAGAAGSDLTGIVTDSTLQRLSATVIARGGAGTAQLPQLVSDLAVRVAESPERGQYVAIAADRYVDPDPVTAARAILATAHTSWSTDLTVRQAVRTVTATDHGQLADAANGPGEIPGALIDSVQQTSGFVEAFRSALSPADAAKVIGDLPAGAQRCESAAWRSDLSGGQRCADQLNAAVERWRHGVSVGRPSNGSYTLASQSAPLFIVLVNRLPVAVTVQVQVQTVNGVVGFRTDPIPDQKIAANSQLNLRVRAHVQRTGRFQVEATLATPDGAAAIGDPVQLNVRSTALGRIGVIITSAAAVLLLLALLLRFTRRLRSGAAANAGSANADAAGAGSANADAAGTARPPDPVAGAVPSAPAAPSVPPGGGGG